MRLMSTIIPTISTSSAEKEDADKVLNQFLNCVQRCQKRYGGKTELATECDPCVSALCLSLEEVFLHGLRSKPQNIQQNVSLSLKQVTDIVSNSLNLNNEAPTFWIFVKNHLTKHEQERYSLLKQIWTDFGRGRAWLRSALNERSLERYFHEILSNQQTLKLYYENWALFCDQEKSSMLPNMAAGLCSILFAISIDNPSLNNGANRKMDKIKSQTEPIIEAPVAESTQRGDQKRKRKVAKQIISFDEDNSSSFSSSSVPSTSGSITLDVHTSQHSTITSSETLNPSNNSNQNKTFDSCRSEIFHASEENSVFSENISNSTHRRQQSPLIPMEETSGVGELTPVDSTKNDESSISDESVEISTDISAVLTVVEMKNKEEQDRLLEKIDILTKENENLKLQLKEYVSTIQIINHKNNEEAEAEENESSEGNADSHIGSNNMIRLYEKKLVQVAEMHAELMEFNDYIQKSLTQKTALCKSLQIELSDLRGPQNSSDTGELPGSFVNIWIPSAFLTGTGKDAHHVYQIYIRAGSDDWNIYRRYSQFHALHADLKKLDSAVSNFDFPPKRGLRKKDAALVEERRKRLQIYMRKVIAHWPELSNCNSRYLLEQHMPFFRDSTVDPKAKKSPKHSRQNPRENHYTGL